MVQSETFPKLHRPMVKFYKKNTTTKPYSSTLLYIYIEWIYKHRDFESPSLERERMDFCTALAKQLMLREIEKRRTSDNIVVSPLSLNALLNMVAMGLKGPTLDHVLGFWGSKNIDEICSKSSEMVAVVEDCGSSQKTEDGPILAMVNGAWVDQKYPLKDSYKEMLKTIYHCQSKSVDFATQVISRSLSLLILSLFSTCLWMVIQEDL